MTRMIPATGDHKSKEARSAFAGPSLFKWSDLPDRIGVARSAVAGPSRFFGRSACLKDRRVALLGGLC